MCEPPVHILYKNWQGLVDWREITPREIFWGATSYHPTPQLLLRATDEVKQQERTFAINDILESDGPIECECMSCGGFGGDGECICPPCRGRGFITIFGDKK